VILWDADLLTPEILTEYLRGAGLLQRGFVTSFKAQYNQTTPFPGKRIAHLQLDFSSEATAHVPSSIVLKINVGPKEVFCYRSILPTMSFKIAPKVFHAHHDASSNLSNFLLEDLSQSHWQTQWPLPPSLDGCRQALSALAKLHAHWWDSPFLQQDFLAKFPVANWWKSRIDLADDRMGAFFDFMRDRLSKERRSIYESVLSSVDQGWRPGGDEAHVTLLHGDAHFWNFLFPRDHLSDSVIMIDWNSWDVGRGSNELAYMMALHWYPERRSRYERLLLEHYHHTLVSSGVSNFNLDALILDYRRSVIMNLLIPVWQWERGIHPSVWWFHLERGFLAFDDWDCRDLL
jgi:thiamine kinase-like enzyme